MAPGRGHANDAQRTREPPYISEPLPIQSDRWRPFVRDFTDDETVVVTPDYINQEWGDYSQTYRHRPHHHHHEGSLSQRAWNILINNPWVPGVIRILMFSLSAVTLGLGGRLLHLDDAREPICTASPIMVVVLAILALIYLPYIFYDEYFGSPIGIRRPISKARLLFFDMLFVIVYSVNMTLSAENSFERQCNVLRSLDRAVFATVLVTLVAWIMTFSITLLRLIVRIGAGLDYKIESDQRQLGSV